MVRKYFSKILRGRENLPSTPTLRLAPPQPTKHISIATSSTPQKYLALCDKPAQIVQIASMVKISALGKAAINLGVAGSNLVVTIVDTLGNNAAAEAHIRAELDANGLTEATLVHFHREERIYTGAYNKQVEIFKTVEVLRDRYSAHFAGIFCALLSQRFVKIHLEAYPDTPIFMLEDGLASYLDMPIAPFTKVAEGFAHKGIVLAHLKRVQRAFLPVTEEGAPSSHLKKRFAAVDLSEGSIWQMKSAEKCYLGLNKKNRQIMHGDLKKYWKRCATDLSSDWKPFGVVIGQNFSDFCDGFYFRDEVEMYAETCRRLLGVCDRVLFIPHPKSPARLANLIDERVTGDVRVHRNSGVPAEAFFMTDAPPLYAVGFYSTAMWNIQEVIGAETYTALGWSTRQLYAGLQSDIQKQAYRAARQRFHPVEKLERDHNVKLISAKAEEISSEEIVTDSKESMGVQGLT